MTPGLMLALALGAPSMSAPVASPPAAETDGRKFVRLFRGLGRDRLGPPDAAFLILTPERETDQVAVQRAGASARGLAGCGREASAPQRAASTGAPGAVAAVRSSVPNPPVQLEAERLLQALGAEHEHLQDFHGNADARLQRLMVLRFDATGAITSAIDRLESDPDHGALVAALYRLLGFVKDPASIPWLRGKLASPRRADVLRHWFYEWQSVVGIGFGNNPGYGDWPWLTGRAAWLEFLMELHADERALDTRLEILNVLKGFDDDVVGAYFRRLRDADASRGEALLTEAYLFQHGTPPDPDRVRHAIEALARDRDNHDLLLGTADALRLEAFVPYLIQTWDVAEPNTYLPRHHSRIMLEKVTYASGPDSAEAWRAWFAEHQHETRAQWVAGALAEFRALRRRDPAAALRRFADLTYRWNDAAALPLIRELLTDPAYRSMIAGWINMTYAAPLREVLAPIANELAKHPEQLEDWAQDRLRGLGFLPAPPETWEAYVALSNMRV